MRRNLNGLRLLFWVFPYFSPTLWPTQTHHKIPQNKQPFVWAVWDKCPTLLLSQRNQGKGLPLGYLRPPQGSDQILLPFPRNLMAINVHGHADRMMAQLLLDIGRRVVVHQEQSRVSMGKITGTSARNLAAMHALFPFNSV